MRLSRSLNLRAAASVVFAVVALLPLLMLVLLLSWADLLRYAAVETGVFLALLVSVTGFIVFRRLVHQITRLAATVQATAAGKPAAVPDAPGSILVPRLTEVTEISDLTAAFRQMVDDLRGATQRLEDLVFKLGTLSETVELAARVPRMQDLLMLVLQNTMRAVRAARGSIMILEPDRPVLKVVVSQDVPDAVARMEVSLGDGIAGKVAADGQSILVDDVDIDPRFQGATERQYGPGAFICMPVRVGSRIIGVINLAKEKPSAGPMSAVPFSPIDLQFLNALLTYIGYSVENARLLQEAQRSAEQLRGVVENLKTTQAQLVRGETLRAIGQLASGMAHHLNNLLTVVIGRAELALQAGRRTDVPSTLQIILETAREGAEVVKRVQRFGSLDRVSPAAAVDLNEVVGEVVELMRPQWQDEAQRRGCPIALRFERLAIPPAAADAGPLQEALMNVLLNAIEALGEGGDITIRTFTAHGRVHCAVTDNGIGMSEDARRRALEPFFTTKGPKSTGLGLSVAYGIIRRYEGTIEIESAEGVGTTVTLSLPLVGEQTAVGGPDEDAPPQRTLTILVIDDEPEVRAILTEMLEDDGHRVLQAASGQEGLALLGSGHEVDVVLTDLGMPDMHGHDVARAIRERTPLLPVGLVTGWADGDVTAEQRELVAFVLHKPFERALIRRALASLCSPPPAGHAGSGSAARGPLQVAGAAEGPTT